MRLQAGKRRAAGREGVDRERALMTRESIGIWPKEKKRPPEGVSDHLKTRESGQEPTEG